MGQGRARVAIPKRLKVRGRWWRICRRKRNVPGLLGEAREDTRVIWIAPHLTGRELDETLIHEVIHACLPCGLVPIETEEKIADALERPLADLLLSGALVSVPEEA
jgi:hypothetical protein